MIGKTLSRYRIVESLGAGGMGAVYRAHDPHLERDVALKVLREGELADDDRRARFRREALVLSRLNHPAIGTIFDFDTQDGTDFLVMEFVAGESLADRLARNPMEAIEAVDVALQIAEAIEAAHERGVVHRDLKPANVMVTPRGKVKVLDFGIAKLRDESAAKAAALTQPLSVMGTVGYMAPEQLLGADVDGRADWFAFGAVLYQMLAGRAPFEGPVEAAIVNEVLNRPPVPPRSLRPAVDRELEALVLRCLEKDPARRPPAREVVGELRRLASRMAAGEPPAARRIESIAVLPLENLSGDPTQEFFADGMTEALIADLARIGALRVISRTSAMRFKGVRGSLPDIARELGVEAIVEGSVVRVGNRVRITAQLIEAHTDRHLWAERYERDVADVLAIQSEVAQAIAREVQIQLTQREREQLARPQRVDPIAHEAYLKGRFLWNQRLFESLEQAIVMFQRAIEQDPSYAPAFSGLADCHNILADNNRHPPNEAFPRAKDAARRALALDENLAEAHSSLAFALTSHDWDWEAADREFRRAIELDRGYPTAHQWYASLLAVRGRFDEAVEHAREAVRRDPLSFILYSSAGDTCYYARRSEESEEFFRRGIELAPHFGPIHNDLARTLEQAGRFDEALAFYRRGTELTRGDPDRAPGLACGHAAAGHVEEARRILAGMRAHAERAYVPPYAFASVHARLGDVDRALEALERAYQVRDRAMTYVNVNPRFDVLRQDPRFHDLVRRMRLAP